MPAIVLADLREKKNACLAVALSARVVANFIRGELNDHGDLQKAARAVTEEALRRGSVDNVSVILVALNQGDNDDEDPDNDAAQEVD